MTEKGLFEDTRDYATEIKNSNRKRVERAKEFMKMYMLEWDKGDMAQQVLDHAKITVHPLPRKAAQGAKRLMTATRASFNLPSELNKRVSDDREKINRVMNGVWLESGNINGLPVEEDAVLSMIIYDEIQGIISNTKDLLDAYEGKKGDAYRAEIEELSKITPFLIKIIDPQQGYPVWGQYGNLRAYYWEEEFTREDVIAQYGNMARKQLGAANMSRFARVTLCHMYDMIYRHTWIMGQSEPLIQIKHELPTIPIVATLGEGSRALFSKPEEQRQPFLYTLKQTEVWDWLNVQLSSWRTNQAITLGVQFVHEGSGKVKVDFGEIFGYIKIPEGDKFTFLTDKGVLSEADMVFYREAENLGTESTIYNQALGEPLGKGEAYSKVALLHQAGRLPLVTVQRQAAQFMSEIMVKMLKWMRKDGGNYEARYKDGSFVDFDSKMLPEYPKVESRLEIDLPQDQLANANIYKQLEGSLSEEWRMQNILSIENPQEETRRALKEEIKKQLGKLFVQDMLMQLQTKQQQQLAGTGMGPGASPPQGARPSPGMGAGMPPEERQALAMAQRYGGAPPTPNVPPIPQEGQQQQRPMQPPMQEPLPPREE